MKSALITGAAGFIGSHLCDSFLKEGFVVYGMDNFLTGSPDNIAHLSNNKNFKFIEHNVTNYIDIPEEINLVLHFACPASPVDFMNYPIQILKVDSLGTLNTLGVAKAKKARYIFASTSEIYGDPKVHPQKEDYWGNVNPIGPRSVYDEAKRFSEAMAMAYNREHQVDTRIIRIFNTYGPRMKIDDGRVVPNFVSQALKGENLTIYGKGRQTRSFCYVDDLVEGILRISTKEDIAGEVINLGNPDEYKIMDFAKVIIKKTGSSSKLAFKPLPQDDPKQRCPDINKAKRLLGWKPVVSLDIGLARTIDYFKKKMEL